MFSQELVKFIAKPKQRAMLQDPTFVAGLLFGISAAPEIPMPECWMPWTLSGKATTLSPKQVDKLSDALMGQLRWQLDKMRQQDIGLPPECVWHEQKAQRQRLENWFAGLTFAHQQCEPVWQVAWEKATIAEGSARLTRCLKCFAIFADVDSAIASSPEEKRETFVKNLPLLASQLSTLLNDYVTLAGELADAMPGQFEVEPFNKQ